MNRLLTTRQQATVMTEISGDVCPSGLNDVRRNVQEHSPDDHGEEPVKVRGNPNVSCCAMSDAHARCRMDNGYTPLVEYSRHQILN